MRLFQCQNCGNALYFENSHCEQCGKQVGFLPDRGEMSAVDADGSNWIALADPEPRYRFCANWEQSACNWMTHADSGEIYCRACRHNRTIPDISTSDHYRNWRKIEDAKRRLFYSLIRLDLPLQTVASGAPEPLVFDFLADSPDGSVKVMTGHEDGVITISLNEADDAKREAARTAMGEPYRSILGHFRHEVGHYYWDRLVRDGGQLESFRALFGDEQADYSEALQRHYHQGAPADWRLNYVSAYATMHPWEDWAETWAHYLHIVDTLEMAASFGIETHPSIATEAMATQIAFDPYETDDLTAIINAWLPLSYASNSLNRCMGLPDLYPFVIPPKAIEKLAYIHNLIHRQAH